MLISNAREGSEGLTCVDGIEQVRALRLLLDVCIDQERVHLGVDVLHHYLEAVEAPGLRYLYLAREPLDQILIHDTIGSGEKRQDVGDKVAFVVIELVGPIVNILRQVDFFRGPEGCFSLFVHLPDLYMRQPKTTLRVTRIHEPRDI